jgi:hypothetical protein
VNMRIALLVALIFLVHLAACEQTLKSVKPGPVTIDLGDGYTASFTLENTEKTYDIFVSTPSTSDILKTRYYGFQIFPDGGDDDLVEATMIISLSAQPWPMPKSRREPDNAIMGIMGIREVTPMTIDGSIGYVGYDWKTGDPATDTKDAINAFFHYFPGAQKISDGIESYIYVTVETNMFDKYPRSLPVFQALLNTLQIKGNILIK